MLNIKKGISDSNNIEQAIIEVIDQIKQNNVKLVIFFANYKYDFKKINEAFNTVFSGIELIGCTSHGEIGVPGGYGEGYLLGISIASDNFNVASAVIKDLDTRAMLSKSEVMAAIHKVGLDPEHNDLINQGFALSIIDGLSRSEEKAMSLLSIIFKRKNFRLVGGSAGALISNPVAFISHNGRIYTNAAIITFVKTSHKFTIIKENIYEATGRTFIVTKADMNNRIVSELNGRTAADVYAEALGVNRSEIVTKHFAYNPAGRVFGKNVFITSPYSILNDGSLQFYSQIMTGATIRFMKPLDPLTVAEQTAAQIKAEVPNAKLILGFNCLLRHIQFENDQITSKAYDIVNSAGTFTGSISLGEQYDMYHVNQTLTLLALGE